jgi:lysophospholipase L1-like esterase
VTADLTTTVVSSVSSAVKTQITNQRRLFAMLLPGLIGILLPGLIAQASLVSVVSAAPGESPRPVVMFVGSSIFHRWLDLTSQMAPLPVLNRAVDGLQTADLLRMLDSDILQSRPKVIVYYCGSNDVDAGEPAARIFDRVRQFVARVAIALPASRVIFVSINRAPEKQDRWSVVDAVNHLVEAYAAESTRLQYVDVNPVLFHGDGTPRIELYLSDGLHFRPAAYEELARVLKPVLTKAFETP